MTNETDFAKESLVQRASRFATQAHRRIDQRRKYSKQSYEVHLKAVADLVASVTEDQEMIAAAWLHDTVEDTPATLQEIEREFGSGVAELVSDLTDVSRPGDGNRAERKAIDRMHSAQASLRAKTVKLADLIDNCRDICSHDERFARVFVLEMSALLEVLSEADPRLLKQAQETVEKCASQLSLPLTAPLFLSPDEDVFALEREFTKRQQRTVSIFMRAFTALDVAEPLRSFDGNLDAAELVHAIRHLGVSLAGVRKHGKVVGYLLADGVEEGLASDGMRLFRKDQVLDADARLADVILVLTRHDHCFVRVLGEVAGVIQRMDMQKPLVRMWLFGLITSTEMMLRERAHLRWPDDSWSSRISPARFDKARSLRDERQRRGQDCQLIDCLQLGDLAQLLLNDADELAAFGFKSKAAAKRTIKEFESLRNNLAHAQDIITYDWAQIARMTQRIAGSVEEH